VAIIILNDDETYMQYVVRVLVTIFEMSYPYARETMYKAHNTGEAIVGIYSIGLAIELLVKVKDMN